MIDTFVHLEPAVIGSSIVVILKTHVEEDDEGRHAPANDNVLFGCQHPVLLDHTGHHAIQINT